MDVVMYLRKSRAEELKDTTEETLRRHREQLEALAARCGYHIILTFEEVVSGESLYARPQMLAMLEAVSGGDYDAVLCMDIDRLGRGSMAEQGIIFDALRRSNTKIITPDKTYDLNMVIKKQKSGAPVLLNPSNRRRSLSAWRLTCTQIKILAPLPLQNA